MLSDILDALTDQLETVEGLTVYTDVRQVKAFPSAVINLTSQSPTDKNWKYSTRYKVRLDITVSLFSSSNSDLFTLIEDVEEALELSEKIAGTIEMEYSGWTKENTDLGSNISGATLNLAVIYVKGTVSA